jgi:hypothetical protein
MTASLPLSKILRSGCCGLIVCLGFIVIRPLSAQVTHLEADFSNYEAGPAEGQAPGIIGAKGWTLHKQAEATVLVPENLYAGKQVLEFSRKVDGSVYAPLAEDLMLSPETTVYFCIDVLRPLADSAAVVALANDAATRSLSFGFSVYKEGTLRINVASNADETARFDIPAEQFIMNPGVWHRLEFEATPSATPGSGTFSVYVSSETDAVRFPLFTDKPYAFLHEKNTRLYLSASGPDGLQVNHIGIYAGFEVFPANPLPKFPPNFKAQP